MKKIKHTEHCGFCGRLMAGWCSECGVQRSAITGKWKTFEYVEGGRRGWKTIPDGTLLVTMWKETK